MRIAQPVLLDGAVHGIGRPRQNAEPGDDVAVGVQEAVEGSEDRDNREREHGQDPAGQTSQSNSSEPQDTSPDAKAASHDGGRARVSVDECFPERMKELHYRVSVSG